MCLIDSLIVTVVYLSPFLYPFSEGIVRHKIPVTFTVLRSWVFMSS